LLLQLLHQNRGQLSKAKRKQFGELTDDEILRIEKAFQDAFQMNE